MSWLEENQDSYEYDEMRHVEIILEVLDKENIEKIYQQFEKNYYFMVCDILKQFKEGKELTDKQKYCIAKFIAFNNLDEWVE